MLSVKEISLITGEYGNYWGNQLAYIQKGYNKRFLQKSDLDAIEVKYPPLFIYATIATVAVLGLANNLNKGESSKGAAFLLLGVIATCVRLYYNHARNIHEQEDKRLYFNDLYNTPAHNDLLGAFERVLQAQEIKDLEARFKPEFGKKSDLEESSSVRAVIENQLICTIEKHQNKINILRVIRKLNDLPGLIKDNSEKLISGDEVLSLEKLELVINKAMESFFQELSGDDKGPAQALTAASSQSRGYGVYR